MGGPIKTSLNCLSCCMKYVQKVIHFRPITMRQIRYCVKWIWSTRKYMFVQMIVYCIKKKFEGLHMSYMRGITIQSKGWWRWWRWHEKGPPIKVLWYLSIIPDSNIFLSMLRMQRIWHGMQMEENVMGCYNMLLIYHNEKNWLFISRVWEWSNKSHTWSCNWWNEFIC